MQKLPALKVQAGPLEPFVTRDFEDARDFPYGQSLIIVVEGHLVGSYDDLLQLVARQGYQNREYLEVKFMPLILGG